MWTKHWVVVLVCLLGLTLQVLIPTAKKATKMDNVSPGLDVIYSIAVLHPLWIPRRGIGKSYKGTLHVPLHITSGLSIHIGDSNLKPV